MEEIKIRAYLPPIQRAITIGGEDAESNINLRAPETEIANVVRLITLKGKALDITVKEAAADYEKDAT